MPAATSEWGFAPVMSLPRNTTSPSQAPTSPNTALSTVDLPAPLGPTMPAISPSRRLRLQLLRMGTPGR